MKTLTITDAKKNLGRWLAAAARGEDIGIVCGADIVALRKVDVESTDYAQREYGAIPEQLAALEKATEQRYRRLKQRKKIASITPRGHPPLASTAKERKGRVSSCSLRSG